MVARVEDCFLGKEQGITFQKSPWKWSSGANQVVQGVRDGEALNSKSPYDAQRRRNVPTWTNPCMGYSEGLQDAQGNGQSQPVNGDVAEYDRNDGIPKSFVSSYLMAQSQAAATLVPGRAEVTTSAPGLARNPSFESINNTGSCSTPSLCAGSPVTVYPSQPCDSGSKVSSEVLLKNEQHTLGPYSESREPQLSDHSLSSDSLSYGGSIEDRETIVNCVDDFWNPQDMISNDLLPDFRFEPVLDDTADTGACGLTFSVGELDAIVSTNHGNTVRDIGNQINVRSTQRGFAMATGLVPTIHTAPAPDFCQSFLVGADEAENSIIGSNSSNVNKPGQLAIPAKHSLLAALNASSDQPGRLRWSDQPWLFSPHVTGNTTPHFIKQPEKSPMSLAGSSPSSPTTPLDPHLFATSLQRPSSAGSISTALKADELQKKLTEFNGVSNNNKRSLSTMQISSQVTNGAEAPYAVSLTMGGKQVVQSLPSRIQGGTNTDKFDAAALSALLYSNTQVNQDFRSYSFKDSIVTPPAPKQRRRHGTATDPQSIAARTRREKFTDRIRILQSLVPNGERLDTVHMLSQTFEYVRFLQHKVWDLYNGKDSLSEVKCEKWKEFMDSTTGQVIV